MVERGWTSKILNLLFLNKQHSHKHLPLSNTITPLTPQDLGCQVLSLRGLPSQTSWQNRKGPVLVASGDFLTALLPSVCFRRGTPTKYDCSPSSTNNTFWIRNSMSADGTKTGHQHITSNIGGFRFRVDIYLPFGKKINTVEWKLNQRERTDDYHPSRMHIFVHWKKKRKKISHFKENLEN